MHKTHERTQLLHLRGGVTNDRATVWFALTNVAIYVVIYKAMTTIGGIRFITISCWCVWALWLLLSPLFAAPLRILSSLFGVSHWGHPKICQSTNIVGK